MIDRSPIDKRSDDDVPGTDQHDEAPREVSLEHLLDRQIPVSAVLGEKTTTIQDILRMAPGHIMVLGPVEERGISLKAGDKVIGVGTVVEVEGRLALRMNELEDRGKLLSDGI